METLLPTIPSENLFYLLSGALFSAQLIAVGGGFISGGFLLFSLVAFLVSLPPVYRFKTLVFESCRVKFTYLCLKSRKNLTHRNDPLLI